MQIHLLYFVKPCQNRPESPADEWRALNINWVSRQSSGCTAPSDTTGRHCVPKKSKSTAMYAVYHTAAFRDTLRTGSSWAISLRGWGVQQGASSTRAEKTQCWTNLGIFSPLSALQREQSTAGGRLGGDGTSQASGLRDISTAKAASCRDGEAAQIDTSSPAELLPWVKPSLRQFAFNWTF